MTMTVVTTENVAPRLRGYLAVWMVEIRAGVYVANLSTKKRDQLWDAIPDAIEEGSCVMVWATNTESRYDFKMIGEKRRVGVEFDGLKLVSLLPQKCS